MTEAGIGHNSIKAVHLMAFIERIEQTLKYDQISGVFTRKTSYGRYRVGSVAGTPCANGYISVGIDGRRYKAHRLAWLLVHSCWPSGDIDHIDRRRDNNCIQNLREASRSENLANARVRRDSSTQSRGVHKARSGKYIARICKDGDVMHLGTFKTKADASRAYQAKSSEVNGSFAVAS